MFGFLVFNTIILADVKPIVMYKVFEFSTLIASDSRLVQLVFLCVLSFFTLFFSVLEVQLLGLLLDLGQVHQHFTPAIPPGVIRIRMERSLEGSHPVFEKHHVQFLLNGSRRVLGRADSH